MQEEQHSPIQIALNKPPGKVFENFSIWGLPSKFKIPKSFGYFRKVQTFPAQLLYKYPNDANIPEQISEFIVPKGIDVKPVEDIGKLIESSPTIHVTFYPSDSMFCICITRKELLQFPSDLIDIGITITNNPS